jgi:hypothetical protein
MTTPNEEWGLIDKVAIVTGGGAVDAGIGNGRAAAICWRVPEPRSWLSTGTSLAQSTQSP